mmetsp:Transcript_23500/g.48026  ORF Transcript_23500/g.48026 Transcript_23500/m.48026 type:complete len:218 (-) Transcript_23500:490-1143(-)
MPSASSSPTLSLSEGESSILLLLFLFRWRARNTSSIFSSSTIVGEEDEEDADTDDKAIMVSVLSIVLAGVGNLISVEVVVTTGGGGEDSACECGGGGVGGGKRRQARDKLECITLHPTAKATRWLSLSVIRLQFTFLLLAQFMPPFFPLSIASSASAYPHECPPSLAPPPPPNAWWLVDADEWSELLRLPLHCISCSEGRSAAAMRKNAASTASANG